MQVVKKQRNLLILAGFLLFVFLLIGVCYEELKTFDSAVIQFINRFENKGLTSVFILITFVGSYKFAFPFTLILSIYFFVKGRIYPIIALTFNVVGVRIMNSLLKHWYSRERPIDHQLIEINGLSFPSGHSMNSMAFFGFLTVLFYFYRDLKWRHSLYIILPIAILIFLIGISRVYLGVHYPTDVLGGFSAGVIWAILSYWLLVYLNQLDKRPF